MNVSSVALSAWVPLLFNPVLVVLALDCVLAAPDMNAAVPDAAILC